MKKVQLKAGHAALQVHPERGGLLTDLYLEDGRGEPVDILWKSDSLFQTSSGWPMGGLPFLFPFGGRVYHDDKPLQYCLQGKTYHMPLHGFAYGVPWQVASQGILPSKTFGERPMVQKELENLPSQVTLTLEDSPTTQSLYPFHFLTTLQYSLERQKLTVSGSILCRGPVEGEVAGRSQRGHLPQYSGEGAVLMPVAPGFHPFFKTPLRGGKRLRECFLETSAKTLLRVTPQGLAGKASALDLNEGPRSIVDLDLQNAILSDLTEPHAVLIDRDERMSLELKWARNDPFKHLVLWTQQTGNEPEFYCIEPWTAMPDALSPGHGAIWLNNGEQIQFGLSISLRDQRL